MSRVFSLRNTVVASIFAFTFCALDPRAAGAVDGVQLDQLYDQLEAAEVAEAANLAAEIALELSRSGSASADLLLKRGREALERHEARLAVEHLTALTDHAPQFAEGWYMRARGYIQLKMVGPALDDLGRALLLEPRHYLAIAQLASLLEELGMDDLALEAYERLHDIYPQYEPALEAITRLNDVHGTTL